MLYPESNDLAKMSRLTVGDGRGPVCGSPIFLNSYVIWAERLIIPQV